VGAILHASEAFDAIFGKGHYHVAPVHTKYIIGANGNAFTALPAEVLGDVRLHCGNHKWFEEKKQTVNVMTRSGSARCTGPKNLLDSFGRRVKLVF
jgi:hypothetical protein